MYLQSVHLAELLSIFTPYNPLVYFEYDNKAAIFVNNQCMFGYGKRIGRVERR